MASPNNRTKRKHAKKRFARLRRANRSLREKVGQYRKVALTSGVAALVLALLLGFVSFNESDEAVLIGQGRAGVMTAEEIRVADSLRIADSLRVADSLRAVEEAAAAARAEAEAGQEIAGGEASYYANKFEGRRTASGEAYRGGGLTAAHRTLPFGSRVRVTNLRTGESVVVRINDRGPFAKRRVIDLSRTAAQRIGMLASGTARVRLELLES